MKSFVYVQGLPVLKDLETDESTGSRFYISPNGNKLPSVTTVLGHFKKNSIQEWRNRVGAEQAERIKTRASIRGTKFHAMMERYVRNQQNIFEGVMPDMKQAFFDARPTIDKIDNIHYVECSLYSEKLGLAGRTDVIGEYEGVLSVIDFKTSLKLKKEQWIENYFEQGTAYAIMYEELVGKPINQVVVIISVDEEPDPQIFKINPSDYVESLKKKIRAYQEEHNYHVR